MADSIFDTLNSPNLRVALLRSRPSSLFNLAGVIGAGLVSLQPANLAPIASDRVLGYRGFAGGVLHTVHADDLEQWPWGLALVLGEPPTALIAVREGSSKQPPEIEVGEQIRVRFEVWATEGGELDVQ